MIYEAIKFAVAAHCGQKRKWTAVPYALHPLAAARTLLEAGCPEHVGVAAALHDIIEDTPISAAEITERFGPRVTELVLMATEPDKQAPWEDRKRHTLETLRASEDIEALLVTLADKLDNIESIRASLARHGEAAWSRFKRGRDEQRWYYSALRDIYVSKLVDEPGASLAARFDAQVRAVFDP